MDADPIVGKWYKHVDTDEAFLIVSFDEDEEIIEIENVDGEREQIDTSAWSDMELEAIDEPEDWAGRPEDLEADDLDHDESDVDDDDDWDDEEEDDDWDEPFDDGRE